LIAPYDIRDQDRSQRYERLKSGEFCFLVEFGYDGIFSLGWMEMGLMATASQGISLSLLQDLDTRETGRLGMLVLRFVYMER
jgi:hypothetical protein